MILFIALCMIILIISIVLGQKVSVNIIEGVRGLSRGIDDFF